MDQNDQGLSVTQNYSEDNKKPVLRSNYSLNEVIQRVNSPTTKLVTLNDLRKEVKNLKFEVQELKKIISEHEKQIYDLQMGHNVLTNLLKENIST